MPESLRKPPITLTPMIETREGGTPDFELESPARSVSAERNRLWRERNPERALEQQRRYRATEKGKRARYAKHLKTKYGITHEEYDEILARQNGVCAICHRRFGEGVPGCVDHNHETGEIRGLLCRTCNTGIGGLRENFALLNNAVAYLKLGTNQLIHPWAAIGGPPQHFKGYEQEIPPIIHPTVSIREFTSVDCGTERATAIGANTMVLSRCNIGHDVIIGHDCQIADSVVIAGHAELGDYVRVGIGAMILPYRQIGDHARVGAGAIVTRNVPAYACVAGNPARVISWFCPECGAKTRWENVCDSCAMELAYT